MGCRIAGLPGRGVGKISIRNNQNNKWKPLDSFGKYYFEFFLYSIFFKIIDILFCLTDFFANSDTGVAIQVDLDLVNCNEPLFGRILKAVKRNSHNSKLKNMKKQ